MVKKIINGVCKVNTEIAKNKLIEHLKYCGNHKPVHMLMPNPSENAKFKKFEAQHI